MEDTRLEMSVSFSVLSKIYIRTLYLGLYVRRVYCKSAIVRDTSLAIDRKL